MRGILQEKVRKNEIEVTRRQEKKKKDKTKKKAPVFNLWGVRSNSSLPFLAGLLDSEW